MDTLTKVMNVNQHQIDELARYLEAFEQIRNKAVEAVPEIHEQVDMAGAWMMFRFSKWFGSTSHRRRTEHRLGEIAKRFPNLFPHCGGLVLGHRVDDGARMSGEAPTVYSPCVGLRVKLGR